MKKFIQFLRNPGIRLLCVIAFIASVITLTVGCQWIFVNSSHIGSGLSVLFESYSEEPEETATFGESVIGSTADLVNWVQIQELFAPNGEFNANREVDISVFSGHRLFSYEDQQISEESSTTISYRLDDLIKAARRYKNEGGPDIEIEVQRTSSGEYTYTHVPTNQSDRIHNLADGSDDIWIIEIPGISIQPLQGSWISLFNENPELNGNMVEYGEKLRTTLYRIAEYYDTYKSENPYGDPSRTNLRYYICNTNTGKYYTNLTGKMLSEVSSHDDVFDRFRMNGHFIIMTPSSAETDLNLGNSVMDFSAMDALNEQSDGWTLAVRVDTDYPANDYFRMYSDGYKEYSAGFLHIRFAMWCALALLLLSLLALTFGDGYDEEGHITLNFYDRIKTEIAACLVFLVWLAIFMGAAVMLDYFSQLRSSYLFTAFTIGLPTAVLFLGGYLSLVRRIKAHTLWNNSLLYIPCRFLWKSKNKLMNFTVEIYTNMNILAKTILLSVGCIVLFVLASRGNTLFTLCFEAALLFGVAMFLRKAVQQQKILDVLQKIGDGDLDQKVDTTKMNGDQLQLAELVNRIEDGMKESIEQKMADERMKTELITNVSHDIKTPLTSIINYVDLLKKETADFDHADAGKVAGYLKVLDQKSQRLKTLTEDVIEASKISSGNISLECTNLNLTELISQVEGEYEDKFSAAGLQLVKSVPPVPAVIFADGRRAWRIFGNLYQNAAKYALPNSRVYVTIDVKENVSFVMKNISADSLNISADELTERFVRGEKSRTTEGSGLGLSIARNLTELMGGTFDIYLDGDLFKVTVTFPLVGSQTSAGEFEPSL